jgi:hypothetical protein
MKVGDDQDPHVPALPCESCPGLKGKKPLGYGPQYRFGWNSGRYMRLRALALRSVLCLSLSFIDGLANIDITIPMSRKWSVFLKMQQKANHSEGQPDLVRGVRENMVSRAKNCRGYLLFYCQRSFCRRDLILRWVSAELAQGQFPKS